MKKYFQLGFTLIELLVVVGIIGILATVVIGSVQSARSKGLEASLKYDAHSYQLESALYSDSNTGRYANVGEYIAGECPTDVSPTSFVGSKTSVSITNKLFAKEIYVSCVVAENEWIIRIPYKSNPNKSWCVDSLGNAMQTTNDYVPSMICGVAAMHISA